MNMVFTAKYWKHLSEKSVVLQIEKKLNRYIVNYDESKKTLICAHWQKICKLTGFNWIQLGNWKISNWEPIGNHFQLPGQLDPVRISSYPTGSSFISNYPTGSVTHLSS